MAKKIHLNSPKNCIFSLKKGFEPQYFTLRTLEKYGNLSVKNVLKISPKLRLSVLINFVLIKKKSVHHFLGKVLLGVKKLNDFLPPKGWRRYTLFL